MVSTRSILVYPASALRTIAQPVEVVDENVKKLARDMAETMYAARGVGLAATQVDVHERVITIDVSESRNELLTLINPELLWVSERQRVGTEGCLSIPGIYEKVSRAEQVRVRAWDEHGISREIEAEGLLAVCIQHEMDHLMGTVFLDHLSMLKRSRIQDKIKKASRS